MRATQRITWLLLSLSFLFHCICSQNVTLSVTPPLTTNVTAAAASGPPPTADVTTIVVETTATTTTPATVPTPMVTSTSMSADKPATVTKTPPTSISGATHVVDKTTVGGPPQLTTKLPTASSSNKPELGINQPPQTTVTVKTTATEPPGTVGANKTTNAPTTPPQSTVLIYTTSTTSTMNHGDNKGVTEKTTVTVTSQSQAVSKVPVPTGNTGTTIPPSTLTKAGPTATESSGTKAVNTTLQATTDSAPTTAASTTAALPKKFSFSLNKGNEVTEEEKKLAEVCRRLMVNFKDGTCTMTLRHHNGKPIFDHVEMNGNVNTNQANQYYEELTKSPTDNKTLIAILASCGALLIMIVILAVCASHHRKPYNENQQHLTEELHTVENGYHDNPTLEVMEVQPEMQEKKVALNGEFNDSWIVPIDNLLKEDMPDEEDTHL